MIMPSPALNDMEANIKNIGQSKIKAVIFDLDGTLVDSEPNYFETDRKLLIEYGVMDFDVEMKNKYVGIGSRQMMEDMIKIYQINETIENLLAKKNKYYFEIARNSTVVFPEMLNLLELLSANNYPMALASGSSPEAIDLVLSVTNLKKYFNIILSAENVERGKPAPDIFLEAAKQLGVPSENCLVIEDSQYGVEAAKSAFMHCIALPYLTEGSLHDSFLMADLLFRNGITEFNAEKAFTWVTTRS
jgi:beta-phosphoglucomutase family hydrolase